MTHNGVHREWRLHHNRAVCGRVWCLLFALPVMLFHKYRPNTPAIGPPRLVVVLMTENSAVSAVNTEARSATDKSTKQLTQIPAFMNFLSGKPATSQWYHIYIRYSVATFTYGTVLPHLHGQYVATLTVWAR